MKYLSLFISVSFLLLAFISCSVTKQTACPTFSNKTEKVHKPLFAKKPPSKKEKKYYTKTAGKLDNQGKLVIKEDLFSKIISNDFSAISANKIALNLVEKKPSFIESKVQKILIKQIDKKAKKCQSLT